jgi:hypothetical protein
LIVIANFFLHRTPVSNNDELEIVHLLKELKQLVLSPELELGVRLVLWVEDLFPTELEHPDAVVDISHDVVALNALPDDVNAVLECIVFLKLEVHLKHG